MSVSRPHWPLVILIFYNYYLYHLVDKAKRHVHSLKVTGALKAIWYNSIYSGLSEKRPAKEREELTDKFFDAVTKYVREENHLSNFRLTAAELLIKKSMNNNM